MQSNQPSTGPITGSIMIMIILAMFNDTWNATGLNGVSYSWLTAEYGLYTLRGGGSLFPNLFTCHFLHFNVSHLLGNCVGFAILGTICRGTAGLGGMLKSALGAMLVSSLLVYLMESSYGPTIGSSAIIYGWFGYILVNGIFAVKYLQMFSVLAGIVVFWVFGSMIYGIFPATTGPNVSWLGHLGGILGGGLAAIPWGGKRMPSVRPQEATAGGLMLLVVVVTMILLTPSKGQRVPQVVHHPPAPSTGFGNTSPPSKVEEDPWKSIREATAQAETKPAEPVVRATPIREITTYQPEPEPGLKPIPKAIRVTPQTSNKVRKEGPIHEIGRIGRGIGRALVGDSEDRAERRDRTRTKRKKIHGLFR